MTHPARPFEGATPESLARALLRPKRRTDQKPESNGRSRRERQTPATPA